MTTETGLVVLQWRMNAINKIMSNAKKVAGLFLIFMGGIIAKKVFNQYL
jgi:hypothetical protein